MRRISFYLLLLKLVSCSSGNEKLAASQDAEVSYLSHFEFCEIPEETPAEKILLCVNPPFIENLHTLDLNKIAFLQLEARKLIEDDTELLAENVDENEIKRPKYENIIIIKPTKYFEHTLISELEAGVYIYSVYLSYLDKDKNELFDVYMDSNGFTLNQGDRLSTKAYTKDYGFHGDDIKGCSLPPEGVFGHFKFSKDGEFLDSTSLRSSVGLNLNCMPPDA